MSFLEIPWLIVSLFVRGEFDRNDGPNDTPHSGRSMIGVLAVLALLIVVALWRAEC